MLGRVGAALGLALAVASCGQDPSSGVPVPGEKVPQVDATLTITVSGHGSVTGPAQSIGCTATCVQRLAAGTAVELVATPAAGMQFAGWSGTCTGTGSCQIVLGSDASVGAAFTSAVSDPCDGLRPTLPAARTAENPAGAPAFECGVAMTDGLGNLYFDTRDRAQSWILSLPLASGYATLGGGMTADRTFTGYAADGTQLFATVVSLRGPSGERANGGYLFTTVTCDDQNETAEFEFRRFDEHGKEARLHAANQPCPAWDAEAVALVDAQDRILVVFGGGGSNFGVAPSHLAARWFDASGQPVTRWFDAGTGSRLQLRPLIGGGAALRAGTQWVAAIASGKAGLAPAPKGFEAGKDPRIVLGGRAYAMVPVVGAAGSLDIVEPGGKSCGTVMNTTADDRVFIGMDGTLINLTGPFPEAGGPPKYCTATYYPQALK